MIRPVPQPIEILFGGGVALACGSDGRLQAEEPHGLFAGDTRVLSTYDIGISGHRWRMLARGRSGPSAAQWEMQNPRIHAADGEIRDGLIHARLRRRVDGALHDCLQVRMYGAERVPVRLMLQIDADFADLFEVKSRSIPPRLNAQRFPTDEGVTLLYQRRGFERGLRVRLRHGPALVSHIGTHVHFDVLLEPGTTWSLCIEACPVVNGTVLRFAGDPHLPDNEARSNVEVRADPLLEAPFARGQIDLERLALNGERGRPYLAAGAPWFMALFGRDTLVTSLMSGLLGAAPAEGALDALAALQADGRDDFRDAEPGKLPHELRRGELAHFGEVPHTPYYGTHDAPALFVLTLWQVFRWTGDRAVVARHLPAARRCLAWCVEGGDRDGDGLLEYQPRGRRGYRNQGWKDAGDAIIHADGRQPDLPLATVELQGYWYAALLAMAELLEVAGDGASGGARELRRQAEALRARVEERFWMNEAGFYALALDGGKRVVGSVSSNPGHLLWCGLPEPARARRVAARLLAPDLFSGYGLRTLSADHPAYNPLSYQLGSVWPHDTALAAAGLFRYGMREAGSRLLHALLTAAAGFEQARLPELFCGFSAEEGPPVPYAQANSPQAWAAAAPVLAAQLFLGLVPDAGQGRCYLDPWLPEWLPALRCRRIAVGSARVDVEVERHGEKTRVVKAAGDGIEIVAGAPPAAPLWGPVR
jgi:glycogen debranching enzyme